MKTGDIYFTSGVNDKIAESEEFAKFIINSLKRYQNKDWGNLGNEDKKLNDEAVNTDNRIVAKYTDNNRSIYIITEWNKETTTVLFTDEY